VAARFSLKRFLVCQSGATAVEYCLILSCIFLAIIGGLSAFSSKSNTMYQNIGTTVGNAIR
jgi:Flp pilus assembly pilin Flp